MKAKSTRIALKLTKNFATSTKITTNDWRIMPNALVVVRHNMSRR